MMKRLFPCITEVKAAGARHACALQNLIEACDKPPAPPLRAPFTEEHLINRRDLKGNKQ